MDKIVGVFQKLLPLLGFYPKWVQIAFTFCIATILLTIFALIVFYPAAAKSKEGFVADGSLPALTMAARRYHREYVIESVTMVIQLDAPGSEPGHTEAVDVRIIYTVFALTNVSKFDEGFHSMVQNVRIDRIRGSDPETDFEEPSPTRKTWYARSDIQAGQRRTIVTGARYNYTLPFPSKRDIHDFVGLGPADDAWCYPNQEDVIGQLTIVVQSYRPIKNPNDGDLLLVDRGDPVKVTTKSDRPALYLPDKESSGPHVERILTLPP